MTEQRLEIPECSRCPSNSFKAEGERIVCGGCGNNLIKFASDEEAKEYLEKWLYGEG